MQSRFVVPEQVRRTVPDGAALVAAADADADALADRLHDGALQALVVARYAADACVRGGDPTLARDAVQEALVALRRAVWELRPRGADDLCAALRELSQRRTAAGAGTLDLQLDEGVAARLAPAARAVAYRFVQAATPPDGDTRAVVAAAAGAASVTGTRTPEDVPGWSARAAAVGGTLDTSGAVARLLLPLDTADPEDDR